MSVTWVQRAWALPPSVAGTERLLLLALSDSANDEGFAIESIARLVAKCGISARQVFRHLNTLEKGGWLKRHTHAGQRTVYELTFSDAEKTGSRYEKVTKAAIKTDEHARKSAETPDVDVTPDIGDRGEPLPSSPRPPSSIPIGVPPPPSSSKEEGSPSPKRGLPGEDEHERQRMEAVRSGDPAKLHKFWFPKTNLVKRDRERIRRAVKGTRHCLCLWSGVLETWSNMSWHPLNVRGMLDRYDQELDRCPEEEEEYYTSPAEIDELCF